jgi:CheY-like chemotaxis protein
MAGDRLKCLEVGCDDYLSKPIEKQSFLATVARYLAEEPQPSPADAAS